MELEYGPQYDALRDEIKSFLRTLPQDLERRDFLRQATEQAPKSAPAWFWYGYSLSVNNQWPAALAALPGVEIVEGLAV